jgi:hypothetical protein
MAAATRLYPASGPARRSTIGRDVVCLVLLAFFVWCGAKTYQAVERLTVFGNAVTDTGTSIQNGFGSAASAVSGVPVVGGSLSSALANAGSGTGGNLASLGQQGNEQVHRLAVLLGLVVALLPIVVLLVAVVPGRVRQVRSMTAAGSVLLGSTDPALRQVLAARAAFSLPYGVLLAYTKDPFGDLAAGRYDALIAATYEDAGLAPPVRA